MGQDDPWVSTTLKTRFTQSQQDPLEHFVVRLRQLRAKQLRQLLADPTTVTLEIFNREVWNLGSMIVNGRTIRSLEKMEIGISAAQLPELTTALDQGKVEIHGNSIWGLVPVFMVLCGKKATKIKFTIFGRRWFF